MHLTDSKYNYNFGSVFLYRFSALALSFLYAFLLCYLFPMDDGIKDRVNYLVYAGTSDLIILRYVSGGILSFLFNEPIWLGLNVFLSIFFTPEQVVSFIVFLSASITSFSILKVNHKYILFLLFILIFPQVMGKYVVHLRQGLAISFFLLGWFCLSTKWRWFFFISASLIHTSFFFVVALYFLSITMRRLNFANDLRSFIILAFGLIVSFGLGFITSLLGARQSNQYDFTAASISGLGFIFWLGILILYWLQGREFTKNNAFSMAVLVFYLTTYFFIEVTGRIFESAVIIVLLSSLELTSWRKNLFFLVCACFVCLSWLLRMNQPWLGWGTGV
ncbi:EpsG family protein [Vibrio metschnikovii]